MGLCPVVVLKLMNICLLLILFSIGCQQSKGIYMSKMFWQLGIYLVACFFCANRKTHLLYSHTAKILIESGWSNALFTNIAIKFSVMLKSQASSSKDSFKLMYGILLTCLLLVICSGGTWLCGMKIGYLFMLHSDVSSGFCNNELIIPTMQSLINLLHFTWLSEIFFNNNIH